VADEGNRRQKWVNALLRIVALKNTGFVIWIHSIKIAQSGEKRRCIVAEIVIKCSGIYRLLNVHIVSRRISLRNRKRRVYDARRKKLSLRT
jgi:hypothetical protein